MDLRQGWAPPAWVILVAAALIAIAPLLVHGCSCGHDFDFHLVSWLEAANQIRHGDPHPQWAFSPAYNAGEPRFVFYPPLSWYLGSAIGLLLTHLPRISESAGWSATPIAFTLVALALAGWTMYRLAREFAGRGPATFASVLYLANPYMLFTAFERTAYAELLAAAWMPMLLHGILRKKVTIPRIAVPLALLWVTNAPAAVIGSYTLALVAGVRLLLEAGFAANNGARSRMRDALRLISCTVAGAALGLMVAGFYIVPAAYERRFVQISMAVVPEMRIQDNFLFEHTTGPDALLHDQVLHTASGVAVVLLVLSCVLIAVWLFLTRRKTPPQIPSSAIVLAALVLAVGFVLTPWSGAFWRHAPEAAFLQFPWRATSVLAVAVCAACAAVLSMSGRVAGWFATRWRATTACLLGAVVMAWPAYREFHQSCDVEDTPDSRLAVFNASKGSEPTDEYTPVSVDNDSLRHDDPPYWLATQPNDPPPASTALLPGSAPNHIELRAPRAATLVLNLRTYPAWQVQLDGAADLQRVGRDDGLLALPIPSGASTVDVRWVRTPDQKIGDLTTLLGIGLLAAGMLPARWRKLKA